MSSPVVVVDSLRVRLGRREVLSGVTCEIAPGGMLAVLGPNGSGKSTFVRTLTGLVEPSSGTVLVMGDTPQDVPIGRVGYVPQIQSLDRSFPARAMDLVHTAWTSRWPGRLSGAEQERALHALERTGVAHVAERQLGALSGGELQRVFLARAIAREPHVLVLDEPESGVDAAGTADLYQQLDAFRSTNGRAVVLVTHDWDAAMHHASCVLVLRGRQVSFGPPSIALSEANVRAAFGHVGHSHGMLTGVSGHGAGHDSSQDPSHGSAS